MFRNNPSPVETIISTNQSVVKLVRFGRRSHRLHRFHSAAEPQPNPKNTSRVRSPDFQSDFFIAFSDWGGLHKRKTVERNKESD